MIQKNTEQKLSGRVLGYLLAKSTVGSLIVSAVIVLFFPEAKPYQYYIPVALLVISSVYTFFWWRLFSFTIQDDHVSIQSGLIIRQAKSVNYNDIQSIHAIFGPILALLGLRKVQGFTSSPGQLHIRSSRQGGANTEHRPDVEIILERAVAEEFVSLVGAGDVQKVRQVE